MTSTERLAEDLKTVLDSINGVREVYDPDYDMYWRLLPYVLPEIATALTKVGWVRVEDVVKVVNKRQKTFAKRASISPGDFRYELCGVIRNDIRALTTDTGGGG